VDALYGNLLASMQDDDLDGIPSTWETAHGLDPHDPTDANLDSDGDGFTNYEEYWMGSDPQNASDPAVLWVNASATGSTQNGSPTAPFKTIQAAVDAASATALTAIMVKPGTYYERPYIHGKSRIHVFSQGGAAVTIIDGQGVNSSVVRLYDFDKASFVGFTVRNAVTSWYGAGLRVESTGGAVLIADDVLTGNVTTVTSSSAGGGGLYLKTGPGSRVVNNVIAGNQARRGRALCGRECAVLEQHDHRQPRD
jgi:hypothetical protein